MNRNRDVRYNFTKCENWKITYGDQNLKVIEMRRIEMSFTWTKSFEND